jgi:acylphosphatase
MAITRKSVAIEGRVQGVGFRYHARRLAAEFGLTGWVRNCEDGGVEAEVQGDAGTIDAFLDALRENGPGYVEEITAGDLPPVINEKGFEIRF